MRLFLLFLLLMAQIFANEQTYNRGEMLFFSKGCSSCHGPDAEGSTTYPKLANKKKSYLLKRFHAFKSGKTYSSSQEMMAQFIRQLNEQNINDLATFLSEHKKVETEDVSDDILGGFGS